MWKIFRENYEDTTEELFQVVSNDKLEELRDSLKRRDVWIEKDISVAKALIITLLEKTPSEWSEEDQSNASVIQSASASVIQLAIASVIQLAVASVIQSAIVSVIQSVGVSVNHSSVASASQSLVASVI